MSISDCSLRSVTCFSSSSTIVINLSTRSTIALCSAIDVISDASVKEHLTGDWKEKVRRRMANIDLVIVLCGEYTRSASGVVAEVTIAQEKNVPYFLLAAYSDKSCVKPTSAKSEDKLYKWTWDNLKALVGRKR
jgi:hypothetical protein